MVRALQSLDGVIKAEANFGEKKALVIMESGRVQVEKIQQALLRVGFLGRVITHLGEKD